MKALTKKQGQKGLWFEDIPKPEIGPTDVLIKVNKTAICGTDLHIFEWDEWAQKNVPVGIAVGHEFMGEIAELGTHVEGLKVGQRVSGEGHIVCGHCRNCMAGTRHLCINTKVIGVHRPGCFAEYLSLPAANAFPLPDSVSDTEAAFFDPFGNAVHTALSFDLIGEDVLVTGAGPIGIMAAAVAKHVGARNVVLTDVNDFRLNLAQQMGIKNTVNVQKTNLKDVERELNMKEGFDVGLEMSGQPQALRDILEYMKPGGKIALLGILPNDTQIPWDQVIFKGLFIKGIFGREMFETWYKMTALLQSGMDIKPIVTDEFAPQDFEKAFAALLAGKSGKILFDWSKV